MDLLTAPRKRARAAFTLLLVGIGAIAASCSLLLDTGSLQSGGPLGGGSTGSTGGSSESTGDLDASSAGTTGTSGTTGSDASIDGSTGTPCFADWDCFEQPSDDPCTVNTCDTATHFCKPPSAWHGVGLSAFDGPAEQVAQADDIGLPVLTSDAQYIVLGFWKKSGATSDVTIRRYDAVSATAAPLEVSLNSLPTGYSSWLSSPGLLLTRRALIVRGARLLVAATADEAGSPGVHLIDLEFGLSDIGMAAMQPDMPHVGTSYDADQHLLAPRLFSWSVGQVTEGGMWISSGQLFGYANAGTTASIAPGLLFDGASANRQVLAFAPIEATQGLHAALELSDGNSMYAQLWNSDSTATAPLTGDQIGPHFGISATSLDEGGFALTPASFVGWSQGPNASQAQIASAATYCIGSSCVAGSLGDTPAPPQPGLNPILASNRSSADANQRFVGQSSLVILPGTDDASASQVALVAGMLSITVAGGDPPVATIPINPPILPVAVAPAPAAAKAGERLGEAAIAVTPGGQLLLTWVERPSAQKAVLYARRYETRACN